MKDLITAATTGLFVEVGKVIEHMKAQQDRIADLERQLAEASAPAVEQQPKPVAQMMCPACGKDRLKEPCPNHHDDCQMVADAHLLQPAKQKTSNYLDGMDLLEQAEYLRSKAAPQAADTDKVREAIANISNSQITEAWESCGGVGGFYKSFGYQQFAHAVLDLAADALSSMAAQAPVREVPVWQPIETAPKETWVLVAGQFGHEGWRIKIGTFYDGQWDILGASWPPLFWMPLPAAPVHQEG